MRSVLIKISIDRKLIAVVRVNRFLYNKIEKLYANNNVKTEAWIQIGASLTHPLEGKFILVIVRFRSNLLLRYIDERDIT